MSKRTFLAAFPVTDADAISKTCPLHNIPLLRRLLTAEAALVQPAVLCSVSRALRNVVTSVMDGAGFWRDLTVHCMPLMCQLPQDVAYFLQTGRFGAPDSPEAQNTAWRLNYKRIAKTFLNLRIFCRIDNDAPECIAIVQYQPYRCHAADVFFRESVHCAVMRARSGNISSSFQYDVNCGAAEPSHYRFTLDAGQEQKIHFGSSTKAEIRLKRRNNVMVAEIFTSICNMQNDDPHFLHMTCLELPNHNPYGIKRCTGTVTDGDVFGKVFTCYHGERANVVIRKLLANHAAGEYVLRGPQFTKTRTMPFYWSGGDCQLNFFEFFFIGDLVDAQDTVHIDRLM